METMPYLAIRSAASLIVLERGFVRNYPLDAKNLWRIGRKIRRQKMILNWSRK